MTIEYPLGIGLLTVEGNGTIIIGNWMADPDGHLSVPRYHGLRSERDLPLAQRTTWRCASNRDLVKAAVESAGKDQPVIVHLGEDTFAILCTDSYSIRAHHLTPARVKQGVIVDGLVIEVDVKVSDDMLRAIPPFSEIHVHSSNKWLGAIAAEVKPSKAESAH